MRPKDILFHKGCRFLNALLFFPPGNDDAADSAPLAPMSGAMQVSRILSHSNRALCNTLLSSILLAVVVEERSP